MASGAGVAYALVEPCASSPCLAPGHLYRSSVGEDSWSEVPGVSGHFDTGSSSLVADGHTVFVMTTDPDPEILGSSDGLHFSALPIPCLPEANQSDSLSPASLAASDPEDVAVACLGGSAAGSESKELFISRDGGHTYQRPPDPPFGGDGAELAMPASTTVLLGATSGATEVYRLAPPDSLWTTPLSFSDGGAGLSDLAFVDPAHGTLVHVGAIGALRISGMANPPPNLGNLYLTDDGGVDWHLVPICTLDRTGIF
jgi:hypothetical protein